MYIQVGHDPKSRHHSALTCGMSFKVVRSLRALKYDEDYDGSRTNEP